MPWLWGALQWNSVGLAKPQIAGCSSCLLALWLEGPCRESWLSRRKDQACQPEEAKPRCGRGRAEEFVESPSLGEGMDELAQEKPVSSSLSRMAAASGLHVSSLHSLDINSLLNE